MNDVLIFLVATYTFISVCIGLVLLYRNKLSNDYQRAITDYEQMVHNLQLKINEAKSNVKELSSGTQEIVSGGLENLGLAGAIAAVVPKKWRAFVPVVAPFIEGFLSNPDNIKKIMPFLEKAGIKIPGSSEEQPPTML